MAVPRKPPPPALDGWVAACMEPDEWDTWQRLNPRNAPGGMARRPCADCPVEFARDMRAIGRCNGTPNAALHISSDEEEDPVTKSIDVAVTAPCGTCAHAPICSIRRGLEELSVLEAALPELDAAITIRLGAVVDCRYYLKAKATPGTAPAGASRWTPERRQTHSDLMKSKAAKGELFRPAEATG